MKAKFISLIELHPFWATFVSACLMSFAQIFPLLSFLSWFGLVPFFAIFAIDISFLRKMQCTYFGGFIYYCWQAHWFLEIFPLDWAGFPGWPAYFLLVGGIILLALIKATSYLILPIVCKMIKCKENQLIFIFPAAWIIIEYTLGIGTFGYTFGQIAMSQYKNLFLIQSANMIGALGISGLIALCNGFILTIFLQKRLQIFTFSIVMLILIINPFYGFYSLARETPTISSLEAGIIQGNFHIGNKLSANTTYMREHYLKLSKSLLKEHQVDLILWPETALPSVTTNKQEALLALFAKQENVYLFTGTSSRINQKRFNILQGFNPNGQLFATYKKQKLVPLGEYLPYKNYVNRLFPFTKSLWILQDGLHAGSIPGVFNSELGTLGTLICYDSTFPELSRQAALEGAELFLLGTDDSWFRYSVATQQHLAQSVFRCIENGRYMIRAANTGISSFLSDKGDIYGSTKIMVEATTTGKVNLKNHQTIYTRLGDLGLLVLALLILFFYASTNTLRLINSRSIKRGR